MYLNKLLFPAPHSSYKAKQLENELIWITREKHQKGFKIDRKDLVKGDDKRKGQTPNSSKFMKLFKNQKHSKDHLKQQQKIINNLNLETGSKYTVTRKEIDISKEKSPDKIRVPTTPQFLRVASCSHEPAVDSPQLQPVYKYSLDNEPESRKDAEKSETKKKKKNKGTCLGFLPKMHKGKKVTLEIFDESNGMPPPFKLDGPVDFKQFGPELAHAILNQHPHDTEKESSSDSDEESSTTTKKTVNIPCLYLKARIPTTKTMLYFHGNGEDLYTSYDFLQHLSNNLMINLVAIEYPGYGIYSGSPSEKKVLIDAETVYHHLTNNLKIKEEDIFIFGRSIGSGPATWLASIKNPGLLVLMSPFTSIRAVAKHLAGNLAKYMIKERFNNVEFIKNVKCPVLIIHGKKDTLIPHTQSVQLYGAAQGIKKIYLAEEMTHSDFDFFGDISVPLTSWFKELNLFGLDSKEHDIIKPKEDNLLNVGDLRLTKQSSSKSADGYRNSK